LEPSLTEQLVVAFAGLKKLHTRFPADMALSHAEFFLLHNIALLTGQAGAAHPPSCVNVSLLREQLDVSMPAVSQMLGTLERNHLLVRAIAPGDRRKINITLTAEGEALLARSQNYVNRTLGLIVERLGEEDTRAFIRLFGRVTAILEELSSKEEDRGQKTEDRH
jgi:DNA-binding MarR family transcriptional regulator